MRSISGPARPWTFTSFDRLTRIMPPLRSGPLGPYLSPQRPSSSRSRYPTSISTPSPPTTSCVREVYRSESVTTRASCALGRPRILETWPARPNLLGHLLAEKGSAVPTQKSPSLLGFLVGAPGLEPGTR